MERQMALKFVHFLGGVGLAAVGLTILPVVGDSFGAVPAYQVNRSLKSDRLETPNLTVVKRRIPIETVREVPREPEQTVKPKLLDGCDPLFSPVTVPALAHVSGRCVG